MQRKKEEVKPREVYVNKKDLINSIVTKRQRKKFLTDSQKEYYDILCKNQITICSGPAGVGKSFVAMRAAIDLLCDPENGYEKIIIVRPAVEAEEKLGSLPGNVEEKLDPYIFPSYYLMNKIIGKEAREKLKEVEIIEVFASEVDVETLEIRETISFGVPVTLSLTSSTIVTFEESEELKTELVDVVNGLGAEVVAVEVSESCITPGTVIAVLESETIGEMATAVLPLPKEVLPVGCMNV